MAILLWGRRGWARDGCWRELKRAGRTNKLDEDCHALVTTLSCGTNFLTFDDLRSKLIHYEQHLKFIKSKDLAGIQHSALATSVTSSESGKLTSISTFTQATGSGGNRNNRRNNNCKGNRN